MVQYDKYTEFNSFTPAPLQEPKRRYRNHNYHSTDTICRVMVLLSQELTIKHVSSIADVPQGTIYDWKKKFKDLSIAGIKERIKVTEENRRDNLSKQMEGEANPRYIDGKSPGTRDRKKNPHKAKARNAVKHALAKGILVKGECVTCGIDEDIHGHHEDYSKLLEVIWLCSQCHAKLHNDRNRDLLKVKKDKVIQRLLLGYTMKEVAAYFKISYNTVTEYNREYNAA